MKYIDVVKVGSFSSLFGWRFYPLTFYLIQKELKEEAKDYLKQSKGLI